MPFKSEAQRRKFGEMVKQGKMTQSEFDKWNADTPKGKKLPERVHPQKEMTFDRLKQLARDRGHK